MGTNNIIFLEVLEWFDPTGKEMVHRIPEHGSGEIKFGAQLFVRDSQAAVVLLTDGLQTGAASPALAEADALRAQGVLVFTIGLGDEADHGLLRRVATTPDDHLASPSPGDLVAIYQRILSRVVCRMQ